MRLKVAAATSAGSAWAKWRCRPATAFSGDPQRACAHLVAAVNAEGGPDNITVVIVEVISLDAV